MSRKGKRLMGDVSNTLIIGGITSIAAGIWNGTDVTIGVGMLVLSIGYVYSSIIEKEAF